jgi:hypothetical protein
LSARERHLIETTLGPALERVGPIWVLDLGALPILHGLSVLSRARGERVLSHASNASGDVRVEREIRERENPELLAEFGLGSIQLRADRASLEEIRSDPEAFQDRLRTLLGTLQRPRYRQAIQRPSGAPNAAHTGSDDTPVALVFSFEIGAARRSVRFMLQRTASSTASNLDQLQVSVGGLEPDPNRGPDIRHLEVEDLDRRAFIAGSTRIADTLAQGVRREAERGRRSFTESRRKHDHTFLQLANAGLSDIEQLHVHWGADFVPFLLEDAPAQLRQLMKRVLLALEDARVREQLQMGESLRVDAMDTHVYLDRSQLGRVLNLSLGTHRKQSDLSDFLRRMPATLNVVRRSADTHPQPFQDVSIFLIHHMTSEVLGLIAGLRELGCRDLTSLFVAYAGDAPASYLDPILALPENEFSSLSLVNVPADDSVEGRWGLSSRYSRRPADDELARVLAQDPKRFYGAMQTVALHAFATQLRRASESGRRLLIIEDGGYLAPPLNTACLDGLGLNALLAAHGLPGNPDLVQEPLFDTLAPHLIGSIEHTRNGYDRLNEIQSQRGRLAIPAASIAISKLKTQTESREVSASLLNAVDNVLASLGLVLSRRHCLVLGARGAIGRHLIRDLTARLDDPSSQLWGVDVTAIGADVGEREAPEVGDIPEPERYRTDLIIGVVGKSVIRGDFVEAWLEHGLCERLILVSGSTKTEEFSDVSDWLEGLWAKSPPSIGEHATRVEVTEIEDPVSGRIFGHRYRFELNPETELPARELILVANLTPANFMFYGVPTEAIDEVLAQLLSVSVGMLGRPTGPEAPARLMAVDHEIDAWSRDLE